MYAYSLSLFQLKGTDNWFLFFFFFLNYFNHEHFFCKLEVFDLRAQN